MVWRATWTEERLARCPLSCKHAAVGSRVEVRLARHPAVLRVCMHEYPETRVHRAETRATEQSPESTERMSE